MMVMMIKRDDGFNEGCYGYMMGLMAVMMVKWNPLMLVMMRLWASDGTNDRIKSL